MNAVRLPKPTNFPLRYLLVIGMIATLGLLTASTPSAKAADRLEVIPGFNGTVNAISNPDSNGVRYVGGQFTAFNALDSGGGSEVDSSLGKVNRSMPKVSGSINGSVPDGDGGWFIGGNFTAIGGVPRSNAAHVLADGSVDPDWSPNPDADVQAITVSGSTVYLGGSFRTVSGTPRNYAAAIGTDGILQPWNPNPNGMVNAIAASGSGGVFLGGQFSTVGDSARDGLALITFWGDLAAWDPRLGSPSGRPAVTAVTDDFDGRTYFGGNFTSVNGGRRGNVAAVQSDRILTGWGTLDPDTTPPPTPVLTTKPAAFTTATTATFAFSKPEIGAKSTCSLDSATATACTSPLAHAGLTEGQHSFKVTFTDRSGNASSATHNWLVDLTGPTLKSKTRTIASGKTTYRLTANPDASGVAKVEYSTKAAKPSNTAANVAANTATFAATVTFRNTKIRWIRLQDKAGNWGGWAGG